MFKPSLEHLPRSPEIVPVVDRGLGNSSYLVDLGDGGALIVDPQRDPRPYLRELGERGLKPRAVVETHLHADFVSGGQELVAAGAELWAPAGSELAYPHRKLHEGEELDLGGLRMQVMATPGHTPEHLAYLLLEDTMPVSLFSGGTLVVGGAARTDLISPDMTEQLARAAYRSITERLFTLPDELKVLATHGGGSFCSVGPGDGHISTIVREKTSNPLFAFGADEDTFVARMLSGYGSYPPYFRELRRLNQGVIETFGERLPPLPSLSVPELEQSVEGGAVVVDVRDMRSFASGHIPGAISIPWRPAFATWLGWLLERPTPIIFISDDKAERDDLMWAALTIGFDNLIGELPGGMGAWEDAGRQTVDIPVIGSAVDGRHIVDVRQASEFHTGHAPDAAHIELGSLAGSVDGVPDGPLLLHCGHGERAMTAASLLTRAGHDDVVVLAGGPDRMGHLITGSEE